MKPNLWKVALERNRDRSRRLFALVGVLLVASIALFGALELFSCAAFWIVHRRILPNQLQGDNSPAYGAAQWVPDMLREQTARSQATYVYVPFRITGLTPWYGKYFNNDEHPTGIWRATVNPDDSKCPEHSERHPRTSVWIFGGSAVYGTGVPDGATLPSFLSLRLNRDANECVSVTNFGVEGYVSTQELMLLIEQLKRGGRPDIVIFYDGVNDAHFGMASAEPWNGQSDIEVIKPRIEGSLRGRMDFIQRFYSVRLIGAARQSLRRQSRSNVSRSPEFEAKAVGVVDNYVANQQMASALARFYHFRFFSFWQPLLLYGHKPLVPFEKRIADFDATNSSRVDAPALLAVYREAERRSPQAPYIDFANIFDSVVDPIYLDEVHLGPHGNELAANAVAKYIEEHPAGAKSDSSIP